MQDNGYTTPEGHWLARELLLPDARSFGDVLEYLGEWDTARFSHTNGIRQEDPPGTQYVGYLERNLICDRILDVIGEAADPRERNELGPYCSAELQTGRRSLVVRATAAALEVVAPRIVTSDDRLSWKLIEHKDRGRALVILEHGHIIGSHWLAYIDPATIPAPHPVPREVAA